MSSLARVSRFFSRLVSRSNIWLMDCFSLGCMVDRPSHNSIM